MQVRMRYRRKGDSMYLAPKAERIFPQSEDELMTLDPLLASNDTDESESDNTVGIGGLLGDLF